MSVPPRANAGQDTESQLHQVIAQYVDLEIARGRQFEALLDLNNEYRQSCTNAINAYHALSRNYDALQAASAQLGDYASQLEQENTSLRNECGRMPRAPFSLHHPNNVGRAHALRQQSPRQSRIESLRDPGGGLGLRTPAPRPPASATAARGVEAREGRLGAVGDGRPSSSGSKQEGGDENEQKSKEEEEAEKEKEKEEKEEKERKEETYPGKEPGPAIVDEE